MNMSVDQFLLNSIQNDLLLKRHSEMIDPSGYVVREETILAFNSNRIS